jgi:phage terminase large subunit
MSNFIVTTAIKKLYALKKRKRVIQGGTSAGKTFGILPILIDKALRQPNLEISVVSESIPHLRRGALKDFLKIMLMTGRYKDYQFNKSTLKYTFSNGSYIEFFSIDQEDKLRGARRNVLYVNEANNVYFESYNQLAIRTSGDIWIDFNPTNSFWAHTELVGQEDVDYITLTYKDNEALPDTIIKDIEAAKVKAESSSYWSNWWNVYGLGQIGSLEGACIPDWKEINTLPEDARLLCMGMDFGYTNDPTTLIGLYKYNNSYIFDEIIYKKGLLNSDISNLLKSHDVKDIIYADSAEPKSIAELSSYGHLILPVKKGKDSIVYGINLINQNDIYVTSRSHNLIHELQNYIWMKDREGVKLNKPIDAFNHCIDAARYAITSQLENPHKGNYNIW